MAASDWYAVYTRSRHEKQVEGYLRRHEIETYLPLRRTWSARRDRRVRIEVPALPGYLFVRTEMLPDTRALIKRSSGVIWLVESVGRPARIPEAQIESLRTVLATASDPEGYPYLKVGDRVRVARGPLVGAEGYLVRVEESRHRLVIAVDYVNQALSVEIAACDVEPIRPG